MESLIIIIIVAIVGLALVKKYKPTWWEKLVSLLPKK